MDQMRPQAAGKERRELGSKRKDVQQQNEKPRITNFPPNGS